MGAGYATTAAARAPALDAPAEARLAHLAYHDPLTGLANRARLAERLDEAFRRAARTGGMLVLFSIDLDDFKLVNDGLGHAAGDDVLRQVAARLDTVRRSSDLLARQGGDEFVLLVELEAGADAAAIAASVAERVADVLELPFAIGDAEFRIGASVGASVHPRDASDPETLHRHADAAMYRAKETGERFALYRPGPADPLARLSMAARLRRGLENDAFSLHYQPIYRLPSRELVGVEALLRWHDDGRGNVPPDEFIPVAEKTGVIDALGMWVLTSVCRHAQAWDARGLHPNFGVNVSALELRRAGYAAEVIATVRDHGLDPRRFVLELTESAWTLESTRTLPAVEELRAAGFPLALDDFGAGYSSLARLRRLPVDVIKIDRAFMDGIPEDPHAVAIIDAIFGLADACGCDVVTEGVETESQLELLIRRGRGLAQGFGLGRPQPVEAITTKLEAELIAARRSATRS
jgi:diguanylate cyclase (GGDEF)-like protein